MIFFEDSKFIISLMVAIASFVANIVQQRNYKQIKNKIGIWSKDAKGMAISIFGMQKNIKDKKISSLSDVASHLETLGNFANSMYTSMEGDMGRKTKDITKK